MTLTSINKTYFAAFLLALFTVITSGAQDRPAFKVVGYYSLSSAVKGGKDAPLKYLTHVNLWFLNPDSAGNFTMNLSGLKSFVENAHRWKVKVLFSIGGGSKQPQYHWLLQDDKRTMLIQNLMEVVREHGLDGVDVDLEGSNIDEYYEKFVTELGSILRSEGRMMTAAIAVYYKEQLTDAALSQFDFVNVMSYDRTGPWRPEKPGPHATLTHAVEDLRYFGLVRKIPKEKMTLGVPFYGYGYGPEITSPAISMSFDKIVTTYPGSEFVDEWKLPDDKIIYYNGVHTIRQKTELAKEKASGIMIWQVLGDAGGKKSLLREINRVAKGK